MSREKKSETREVRDGEARGEGANQAKVVSAEKTQAINEALGLQMISIRLPKSVIDDFKVIAKIEGIGYQPLMRIALTRFAECEAKRVMREYAAQLDADKKAAARKEAETDPRLERKAA